MSMHLKMPAYICKKCQTEFIAYSKGLLCPKCGRPEESQGEAYDFIDKQVGAMISHKNKSGQFRGYSWSNSCLCDAIQWNVFNAFDYAYQNPDIGWTGQEKGVDMIDGTGKRFSGEQYLRNIYKEIDKRLKDRADEITVKDVFDEKSGKFLPKTDIADSKKLKKQPSNLLVIIGILIIYSTALYLSIKYFRFESIGEIIGYALSLLFVTGFFSWIIWMQYFRPNNHDS